jgi:TPP-dependent pyruvate/acetoin dehydrogenase alpha subunit
VLEWSKRDPLVTFSDRLAAEGILSDEQREARFTTTFTFSAIRSVVGTRPTTAAPACARARSSPDGRDALPRSAQPSTRRGA